MRFGDSTGQLVRGWVAADGSVVPDEADGALRSLEDLDTPAPGPKVTVKAVAKGTTRSKLRLKVKVSSAAEARPTGKVTVTLGGRSRTLAVKARHKGKLTVRLTAPRSTGKLTLRATDKPSASDKPYLSTTSSSRTTVRVR